MSDPNEPQDGRNKLFDEHLLSDAKDEITAMAKEGLAHPSSKPVITGAAVGALAGLVLPVVTWPLGLLAGAGVVLYKRLRP